MPIRIVRLGTPRAAGEGLRIGTVRRPPRGVAKSEFASQDWYDLWYPNLAPSVETMKLGQQASSEPEWQVFRRRFRSEMAAPEVGRTAGPAGRAVAADSFAIGCYCEDESRCHRSVLRALLAERGAELR